MNYTGVKEVIHSVFQGSGGGVGRMTVGGGGGELTRNCHIVDEISKEKKKPAIFLLLFCVNRCLFMSVSLCCAPLVTLFIVVSLVFCMQVCSQVTYIYSDIAHHLL